MNKGTIINQMKYQQIPDLLSQKPGQPYGLKPQPLYKQDHRFDEYIKQLKQKGVQIHHKLRCGWFKLKNGLSYPGLYTEQAINQGLQPSGKGGKQIVLVTVPVNLLLTAYHAQNQGPQELKDLYKKEKFYHQGLIWQNRILVTYLLYNLENNKENIWSEMASHFSREIDIIQFWSLQDLNKFSDKSLIQAALHQKQNFQKQWQKFSEVRAKNSILKTQTFNYVNYKWIYTHVVSRCFGSYMNSSYFTPFCQFLNHNCVDVSFCCVQSDDYQQSQIQLSKEKQQISSGQKQKQQEQMSQFSECSGDSQQYIQQDDFSYQKVTSYNIKWFSKISFNLKPKQVTEIHKLKENVLQYLDRQLNWKGFTLLYIGQILQRNNLIVNEFLAQRKKFPQAKQELNFLLYHASQFARRVKQYYKRLGSTYFKDKDKFNKVPLLENEINSENSRKNQQKINQLKQQDIKYNKTTKPPQKQYKNFKMVCHSGQKYEKNCEVYFQYGRLSNRTLLLCYGFCLENNMYEHVWIHRSLAKQIGQYPDLFNKIQEKGIPITMNIKLKPYLLNTELITLQKIQKWKIYGNVAQNNIADFQKMFGIVDLETECEIIGRVIEIYEQEISKYDMKDEKFKKLENGLIDLSNQRLGYHEYFTAVYNNEKVKIIRFQIYLLKKVSRIFKTMIQEKVTIKGNSKLLKVVKDKSLKEMGGDLRLTKGIWGYVRNLCLSIIS